MRREEYACPNGCSLPPRKKQLREYRNGTYGFDFYDFTFCPCCGSLMPYSLKKLKGFFEVYNIHAALSDAVQLIYKSEFESAAREAFVAVESYLKKNSGLDSHGFDLATRALSFEIDKQTGEIKRAPLIAINDLKNESERNEQDGIRYMLMGFFQGPRNLYQHNHIGSGVSKRHDYSCRFPKTLLYCFMGTQPFGAPFSFYRYLIGSANRKLLLRAGANGRLIGKLTLLTWTDMPGASAKLVSVFDLHVRRYQHHAALAVGSQNEHLRHEVGDLPRREVHHCQHLLADKLLRLIVIRYLRRRPFHAYLFPEVERQLIRRLPRLFKDLRVRDGPGANIQLHKIIKYSHFVPSFLFAFCLSYHARGGYFNSLFGAGISKNGHRRHMPGVRFLVCLLFPADTEGPPLARRIWRLVKYFLSRSRKAEERSDGISLSPR